MRLLAPISQVKLDQNKDSFDKISVKSNYTGVNETFGQWLIRQRKLLGLNQADFARRAGMTKGTLSLYEKDGVSQPRFRQLDKIARALGKPSEEVRRAAAPHSDATYDILDIATVMFQDESKFPPEKREEFLKTVRQLALGMISERRNSDPTT